MKPNEGPDMCPLLPGLFVVVFLVVVVILVVVLVVVGVKVVVMLKVGRTWKIKRSIRSICSDSTMSMSPASRNRL